MSQASRIEWTEATWNPTVGCTKISPGCKHCYAESMAKRLQAMGTPGYENGFKLTILPERLAEPLARKKPTVYFVNSMSDLFHEKVPFDYVESVFQVMAQAHWHTFQVLTKRAEPEMIDIGGTKVLKSAVPEAVLKALEAQTAELAVAKAREADAALEKRGASELPNLKGTALAKGRLLSMIGDDADLLGAIKAADAAFAAAFTEVGDHGQDASPIDQIEKLARAHMAEQKVPYETAFAAVTSKGEGARLWKIARQPSN